MAPVLEAAQEVGLALGVGVAQARREAVAVAARR
jgi:hypothetical protein